MSALLLERRWSFLLLLLLFSGAGGASEVVVSAQQKLALTPHIHWYYDASATATISQISADTARFQGRLDNASLPRAAGAYWLWFELRPAAEAQQRAWWLALPYTQLDEIDLYVRDESTTAWQYFKAGDQRPLAAQPLPYLPQPVFPLSLTADALTDVFVRIHSSTSITVPLTLWQRSAFEADQLKNTLVNGIVYGVLIGLVFYNLFLYPTVKDNAYLWFSVYLGAFLLFQFSMAGFTRLYLLPDWPALADRSASLALWLCMAGGLRFTQYISLSQQYAPRLHRLLSVMVLLALLMMVSVALLGPGPLFFVLPLFGGLVALLIPLPLIAAWRAHYPPAKFTLIAFLPILPGVVLIMARTYGLVDTTFWTEHLFSMGTAVAAVLLSFALADRISFLRNEKLAAQAQLIDTIHAADAAKKRFSTQLINAQDSERKRIAEELHDGVGQNLSFLASSLNRLAQGHDSVELQQAKQVSRDTVNEVRAISHQLHPYILDQLGLVTAIESIAERIDEPGGLRCRVDISDGFESLDGETELHLFRIVQESVSNAMKHAGATWLDISLQRRQEMIHLSVTDNGVGLKSGAANAGLGVASMKHRAVLLGGTFELKPITPQGTRVVVILPVEAQP